MPILTDDRVHSVASNNSLWQKIFPSLEREVRSTTATILRSALVSDRDLIRQLLLHLPRFSSEALKELSTIECEAKRLADKIESRRTEHRAWQYRPKIEKLSKKDLVLQECDPEIARIIHERFHYIGSYHEGIVHLGLFLRREQSCPIALASLAPMDILRLDHLFPSQTEKKKALVISRVFAFDWAPKNTISHLLSLVSSWIGRNLSEVQSLFTFLNPNLGFSGSSFKASNWHSYLEIEPVSSYIQDDYVPYRVMLSLPEHLRKNAFRCIHDLAPLKLLRYDLGANGDALEYDHSLET